MEWKDKIRRDVEKWFQEFKGSGVWLQEKAVEFEHGLKLTEEQKTQLWAQLWLIFDSCKIATRRENIITFEILIANLLKHKARWPIRVSLSPYEWKKIRYLSAGASVIGIIKKLKEGGFLEMKKGYYTEKDARKTRIWPTEKLLRYLQKLPNGVIYEPVELVELRDEKGRLEEYTDTQRTRRIRSILKHVNKVNQKADIRYHRYRLSGFLVAIFNRSFTFYGRLHTRGYRHYQSFSEDERAEITINGEPVVELDYSGLHPYLLYAKEGIQFWRDPYSIIDSRPEVRPFLKLILLTMLNAKDETEAERAANYWLYRNHEEREDLAEIGITKARSLIEKFRQEHKKIDHYFCKGKETSLRIMNQDTAIAQDIVRHFTEQDIPILAIHDSFIVQEKYRDELYQTMKKFYRKHTGFRIPVK